MRIRRVRVLRASSRRESSPFMPGDYAALEHLFAGKPETVPRHFQDLGIGCLMELETFARLRAEQPAVASRIAFVAATMGIPVGPAD